jgi:hypothetical protein
MQIDDGARVAALLAAYLAADYSWELDNAWHALRIGHPSPELDATFPEATSFSLMSAWNPQSILRPDVVNRAEDRQLQFVLESSGLAFRPAFAAAPNRSWREPSWVVVDLPLPQLDALMARFAQLGALLWRRGERGHLRMYAAEPLDHPGYTARDCVDWVK